MHKGIFFLHIRLSKESQSDSCLRRSEIVWSKISSLAKLVNKKFEQSAIFSSNYDPD